MDITTLLAQPESLNSETLPELRALVAGQPYFHAARLLMLKNLFITRHPDFETELRRAALLLPRREILFDMVQAANYELRPQYKLAAETQTPEPPAADRTAQLLDLYLAPNDGRTANTVDPQKDYMGFLAQQQPAPAADTDTTNVSSPPTDRTDRIIGNFIEQKRERLIIPNLKAASQAVSESQSDAPNHETEAPAEITNPDEACFTETLAKIYIRQGKYERAFEIISKLNLNNPKKSAYFADQMRFLQKLMINAKHQ